MNERWGAERGGRGGDQRQPKYAFHGSLCIRGRQRDGNGRQANKKMNNRIIDSEEEYSIRTEHPVNRFATSPLIEVR